MTQRIRNRVLEIVGMAVELNSVKTAREVTGDKPTIFIDFSGHTAGLTVEIHTKGYSPSEPYSKPDKCWCVYLDWGEESVLMKLDNVIKSLRGLLDEWGDKNE